MEHVEVIMSISKKSITLLIFVQLLQLAQTSYAHIITDLEPIVTVDEILPLLKAKTPTCIVLTTDPCPFCTILKKNLPSLIDKHNDGSKCFIIFKGKKLQNSWLSINTIYFKKSF
jgi:hypothetical protein